MAKQIQSVGNSNTIPSKLFDAVAGQQQAKYYKDGLDYISNDTNIIPRDEVGNIVLNEDSTINPKLVISAVTEQIATKSVLRVLDTRFQYFKFPVQIAQGDTFNINTGFNIDIDTITTELKLPIQVDGANQPIDLIKINIEGDEFALMNCLLNHNIIDMFDNIQIQFHSFMDNAIEMRNEIQNKLIHTHHLTYNYDFVWENWEKNKI
jgi:hypothetical protein